MLVSPKQNIYRRARGPAAGVDYLKWPRRRYVVGHVVGHVVGCVSLTKADAAFPGTVASLQAVDAPGTCLSAGRWRTTGECCRRVRPVSAASVADRCARHRPASPDVLLIDLEQYHRPVAAAVSTSGFVVQLRAIFWLQVGQTIAMKMLAPRSFLVRLSSALAKRRSHDCQSLGQRVRDPSSSAQRPLQIVLPPARPAPPFFSPPAVGRSAWLAAIVAQRNRLKRQVPGGKSA